MSLLNAFEHLLGLKHTAQVAPKPVPLSADQEDGRSVLGIQTSPQSNGGADLRANIQYSVPHILTPQVTAPQQPSFQIYGDAQGNRWFENDAGQRLAIPEAPQTFDAPANNSFHDPVRPGQNLRFSVGDGVAHPSLQHQNLLQSRLRSV